MYWHNTLSHYKLGTIKYLLQIANIRYYFSWIFCIFIKMFKTEAFRCNNILLLNFKPAGGLIIGSLAIVKKLKHLVFKNAFKANTYLCISLNVFMISTYTVFLELGNLFGTPLNLHSNKIGSYYIELIIQAFPQ